MAKQLTDRQAQALRRFQAGKTVDKGMLRALETKGYITLANSPPQVQSFLNTTTKTQPASDFTRTHTSFTDQEQACIDKIENAFRLAEQRYGTTLERPVIRFSNKLKTSAGNARWIWGEFNTVRDIRITLSKVLLQLNGDEFIADTPGHEAAHIIALQLYGQQGKGHGARWKEVMRAIGQNPQRCHDMQVIRKKQPVFRYRATCGTIVKLKRGRHSKIQRGLTYVVSSTGGVICVDGFLGTE